MASLAVWSVEITPGGNHTFSPNNAIRITNAALGEKLENATERSTLKLTYESPNFSEEADDEDEDDSPGMVEKTTFLCSLTPGKIEQSILDVTLTEDVKYILANSGKNTIHLSGNYIYQDSMDDEPDSDFDEDDDEADPAVYLDEVSSDVEMDPNDLDLVDDDHSDDADRFEEIDEAKAKPPTLKRPLESDEKKLSKKERKKLNKKLKAENGEAIPVTAESATSSPEKSPGEKSVKDKRNGDNKKEKENDKKDKKDTQKTKELPNGLKIRDGRKIGEGPQAKKGDKLKMRYIGKFSDGKIFDSNTSGKPFTFKLGEGEVIKGWDEGIVGMRAGGEREIIVPPELGYGKQGKGTIPGNATLRFECKVIAIN